MSPERKKRWPKTKEEPKLVNNFLVNKTQVARSLNIYPSKEEVMRRDPEDVKQVVNKKVADSKLIHKTKKNDGQDYFPTAKLPANKASKKR